MIAPADWTDSYVFWLLVAGVPAGAVGAMNGMLLEGLLAAVVLAALAHLYVNYPF